MLKRTGHVLCSITDKQAEREFKCTYIRLFRKGYICNIYVEYILLYGGSGHASADLRVTSTSTAAFPKSFKCYSAFKTLSVLIWWASSGLAVQGMLEFC